MPSVSIAAIYRYPVKGLTAEPLDKVDLLAGETLPLDRAWAIENGAGRFDPANPKHLPKINFVMLMRNERLASLDARLEPDSHVLAIRRAGRQVARGDLDTAVGRRLIEQFIAAYMPGDLRGAPRIVSAPGYSISDVAAKCLHIVNAASIAEVARVAGRRIDPLRFRPNLVLDGLPAFVERDWVGKTLSIGAARLEVFDTTIRCEATNVDPSTGQRDMAIPALLQRTWGRTDFGVYTRIAAGGQIRRGDPVTPP